MLWNQQSWPKLQAMDKNMPVVVPLGACEQHGCHLPVFVDTIQVTGIAEKVEKMLSEKILLTPTLWLGNSQHHKDFPGTLTLPPSLYTQVIAEMAKSILRAGFKRIFFLNGHGGNEIPASQALVELVGNCDIADNAYLTLASWWSVGKKNLAPKNHDMQTPFVSHACEYETSLMLALRPDLVEMDQIVKAPTALKSPWFDFEYGGRVSVYRRYHRLTASGSMGSPELATAEKGNSLANAVTADIVSFLEDFATWPKLPKLGPKMPN